MREMLNSKMFALCFVMILSGACNYGFSRFFFAIPFMIIGYIIVKRNKNEIKSKFLIFCGSCILFNLTLSYNPIFFPILLGYVETINNGAMGYYSDPDQGYWFDYQSEKDFSQYKSILPISKGTRLKVTSVSISYADFGCSVDINVNKGRFYNFQNIKYFFL